MSSIDKLIKIHREREKLKFEPYKKIHQIIWNKIVDKVKLNNGNDLIYQIPEMLFGYTQYDVDDCCEWQIQKIKKKGKTFINVELYEKNILYITWDFNKIKKKET